MRVKKMWVPRVTHGNIAYYTEDGRLLVAGDGVKLQAGSSLARQWKVRWNAVVIDAKKDEGAVWFVAAKWFFRWSNDTFQICQFCKFPSEDAAREAAARETRTIITEPEPLLDGYAYLVEDRATYEQCEREASCIAAAINGMMNGETPRSQKALQQLRDAGYNISVIW